jgi:hypothetical protein
MVGAARMALFLGGLCFPSNVAGWGRAAFLQRGGALRSMRAIARMSDAVPARSPDRNVLGGELECCCADVRGTGIGTGFYRNGFCATGPEDSGRHTVCIEASADFLAFSKAVGNDLSQPIKEYLFPGVNPGDRWCLCAARWKQALEAGRAPRLYLERTHEKTLQYATLEQLLAHAVDREDALKAIAALDEMRRQLARTITFDGDDGSQGSKQ